MRSFCDSCPIWLLSSDLGVFRLTLGTGTAGASITRQFTTPGFNCMFCMCCQRFTARQVEFTTFNLCILRSRVLTPIAGSVPFPGQCAAWSGVQGWKHLKQRPPRFKISRVVSLSWLSPVTACPSMGSRISSRGMYLPC